MQRIRLSTCLLVNRAGADARAVRPYMPLACKSFFNRTNPKGQCSKLNVQSQGPYMPLACKLFFNRTNPKVQNSMFKIQSQRTSTFKVKINTCRKTLSE